MKGPLVRLIKQVIGELGLDRIPVTSESVLEEMIVTDQDTRHAFFHDVNPNVTEFDHPATAQDRMESRMAAMTFVVESMTVN